MFTGVKNKILQIRRSHGIEISIISSSEIVFHAVTIKLEKEKVIKEREVKRLTSIDDLKKIILPGSPVAITINGKGVLYKETTRMISPDSVFETVLPNANPNDFYTEITDYKSFFTICIIRKATLDSILNDLLSNKFRVLSVSLGPGDCRYIIPYLNIDEGEESVRTNHYSIHLDQGKNISSIGSVPFAVDEIHPKLEYSIGDQYVFSSGLMAFGSAMGLFAGSAFQTSAVSNDMILKEKEDYKYLKYYKTARWAFIGGIFAILLINFLIYNYYFDKNQEQLVSHAFTDNELKEREKLESAVLSKETFVGQVGWDRPSRISFYADRIAALVPEDAQLTGLKVNPVNTGFFGENNLLIFKLDTIQITGTCTDPTELNRFANNLRNIADFKKVDLKTYTYKKETQNGIFLMEIITK